MRPEQYPPFALIHLNQNGEEFPADEPNTRYYFNTFDEILRYVANSPNYVLQTRQMNGLAVEYFPDPVPFLSLLIRYDRGYLRCLKITGPVTNQLTRVWEGLAFWGLLESTPL
ncbi:hypothetical protein D3C80_878430 [compost metagenome]